MGSGPSGQSGAACKLGKQRHRTTCAPNTTVTTHREGCREIAASSGGIHGSTCATTTAHGLQEDSHRVVTTGLGTQCCW